MPNSYKVFDPENNEFISAKDVIVDEITYLNTRPKFELPHFEKSEDTSEWLNGIKNDKENYKRK